ncbi:MAG TPA: 2'-5' RNA ligase family protein [Dongiaceae bacterium]|jgi:2'-5' RNA ligase
MTATVIASQVSTLPEARAALEAAKSSGVAAELESPPGAASIYGVLWFAELNRALLAEFPAVPFTLTLDCGARADLAHAALVEGIKRIRFKGHPEAVRALSDIAQQLNAELVAPTPQRQLLYVIAEPETSDADRDWIQSIRKRHDPQFDMVGPHFTLVFGTDALPATGLVAHVRAIVQRFPPFAFELSRIEVFPGAAMEYYLFLMPEKGAHELQSLHEALNPESKGDISFVPHMTIGRFASVADATTVAEALNAAARTIRGRVSTLKVIGVAEQPVSDYATIDLKGK